MLRMKKAGQALLTRARNPRRVSRQCNNLLRASKAYGMPTSAGPPERGDAALAAEAAATARHG